MKSKTSQLKMSANAKAATLLQYKQQHLAAQQQTIHSIRNVKKKIKIIYKQLKIVKLII